ncbi:hypothetical protein NDK50_15035 [Paraburkholderia bryophila]|uniref:hypothetical protein n=1 Tax=Paraburkholderia bryophila TaxID=420952 RepID=UPI002349FE64|nr:hypothetical protein [Paraburkholderia bryophila]WCM18746.1 hypothetical protein NDK50_15035 [Paraburkholderia bryophila]
MQKNSHALLASAILAAGPVAAAATAMPVKPLPSQQDIWITGEIQRGHGQNAPGDYPLLRLNRPSTAPCIGNAVTGIVPGEAGVPDSLLLRPYPGKRVALRAYVICPDSGTQSVPKSDFVFPID